MPSTFWCFCVKLHLRCPSSHPCAMEPSLTNSSGKSQPILTTARASLGHPAPSQGGKCCVQPGQGCHRAAIPPAHSSRITQDPNCCPLFIHPHRNGDTDQFCPHLSHVVSYQHSLTLPPLSTKNSFFSPPHQLNSTHFPGN